MSDLVSPQLQLLARQRLVAIIRLDDLGSAQQLSQALFDGGIAIQEFTLTNPAALDAISRVRQSIAEFDNGQGLVGVGSVRNLDQAKAAIAAGAQFVVLPIVNVAVIEYCVQHDTPVMPGAMTPTEILTAWEAGATAVKVFPARSLGSQYIRDVLAPLPELRLMPTGGIDQNNMRDYFQAGAFAVGVGGNLLNQEAIGTQDWQRVTSIANSYTHAVRCAIEPI
ncbi:MAG: bifunctional 4-hydroxy-2-oxoglutarate aldolase/2-dehydro-3-deoxy-phosphogluconate aldolase [Planctomycetales bacterium]|nr:bifunctional 4-hydroxy-2-oxoglutarate aldolase/2-dehydro-3-deoxy-phosphogluconate aldolase [Planctomycetales bacterium]